MFPLILTGNFSDNLSYVLSCTFKDVETEAEYLDIFHTAIRIQAGIQTQPISVPKILNNVRCNSSAKKPIQSYRVNMSAE